MHIKWMRLLIAALLTLAMLVLLARLGDFDLRALRRISPGYAGLAVAFSSLSILLRAIQYRISAPGYEETATLPWLQVSFRHQALFTLLPSGTGDIGFPFFAKRYVGIDYGAAIYTIALIRLRDLTVLLTLASIGMAAIGIYWAALATPFFLIATFMPERAFNLASRIGDFLPDSLGKLRGRGAGTSKVLPTFASLTARSLIPFLVWLSASAALYSAYCSAHVAIQPSEALILLGALNLVGMLAITIGGLGISEAGSAAALIWLGMSLDAAIGASLAARPVLLLARLLGCLIWWLVFQLIPNRPRNAGATTDAPTPSCQPSASPQPSSSGSINES